MVSIIKKVTRLQSLKRIMLQAKKAQTKETVAVGISGGVDSSVAALLLQQAGYNVIGIFVKTWSPEWLPCTWLDEKRDAMRVCAKLGIPFHFLDATDAYKQEVADYMIAEYRAGRTPNPDVLCNRVIKFGAMWQYAQSLGATKIATGHYAATDGISLYKAKDQAKDQAYFLWMLEQQELSHILFPLGALEKKEVRVLAEQYGLHTATKKDSQGVCFLGDIDMREFLSHYIEQKKGDVCNTDGVAVGTHDGVWFYTIGERHGFHITERSAERLPYYVVSKDVEKNILYVEHRTNSGSDHDGSVDDQTITTTNDDYDNKQTHHISERQSHYQKDHGITLRLRADNWHRTPVLHMQYTAQIRYHGALLPMTFVQDDMYMDENSKNKKYTVIIQGDTAIAEGQSIVVYEGDCVLGGAVIDTVVVK